MLLFLHFGTDRKLCLCSRNRHSNGVCIEIDDDPPVATIAFSDSGGPFDPLKKADPDVTLPAEEREIGGLGIFMTKKTMDEVRYEYKDGQNRLTLVKKL